jgi:stage III sporulation protein SpoIIIAA
MRTENLNQRDNLEELYVSMNYNFQTAKKREKLFTEYESVTQNVLQDIHNKGSPRQQYF